MSLLPQTPTLSENALIFRYFLWPGDVTAQLLLRTSTPLAPFPPLPWATHFWSFFKIIQWVDLAFLLGVKLHFKHFIIQHWLLLWFQTSLSGWAVLVNYSCLFNCLGSVLGADGGFGGWLCSHGDGVCLWYSFLWTEGPETPRTERRALPVLCSYTARADSAGHYCSQPLHFSYSRATCKALTLTHTHIHPHTLILLIALVQYKSP